RRRGGGGPADLPALVPGGAGHPARPRRTRARAAAHGARGGPRPRGRDAGRAGDDESVQCGHVHPGRLAGVRPDHGGRRAPDLAAGEPAGDRAGSGRDQRGRRRDRRRPRPGGYRLRDREGRGVTQTDAPATTVRRAQRRRVVGFVALLVTVTALLFGVPLWTLVLAP